VTLRLSPVARKSVPDALYEQLFEAIVSGSYRPGDPLPTERELAEGSGANRLAVREAMQRLRQVGLVEIVHGGGSSVTDWRTTADLSVLPEIVRIDHTALRDELTDALCRFRLAASVDACERLARRWSAGVPDGDTAERLRQVADEADRTGAAQATEEFWTTVFDALGSIAFQLINNTIRESRLAVAVPHTESGDRGGGAHRAVADAMLAGEPDAARSAVEHLLDATI
jgi:GntR family transcriptional repressor for pyruvate dehydrogenase complex